MGSLVLADASTACLETGRSIMDYVCEARGGADAEFSAGTKFDEDGGADAPMSLLSEIVDVGPVAQPILAHDAFPRGVQPAIPEEGPEDTPVDFTPPGASTHQGLNAASQKTPHAPAAHGRQRTHECADCKRGGARGGAAREGGVIVGGVEYAVGGWGRYEVDKRRARWEASQGKRTVQGGATEPSDPDRPGALYGYRTYIGAADVAYAILVGDDSSGITGGGDENGGEGKGAAASVPFRRAGEHLARALGEMQDMLCDPTDDGLWECLPPASLNEPLSSPAHSVLTVPSLTSSDVNAFLADRAAWVDPTALESLAEDASIVAASLGTFADALPPLKLVSSLPPLPARVVQTDEDVAVLRLEAAAAPFIESLSEYQAAVAARLDAVASTIDKSLAKARRRRE